MISKIAGVIRDGNYAVIAARLAGIDEVTYYRWIEWGSAGRDPYSAFCKSIKEAEAQAEKDAVSTVRAGSTGAMGAAWTSAMTFLERRWPDRWSKRDPDRSATADMDRRLKQIEIEIAQAKLATLTAHDGTGEPVDDAKLDEMMRGSFGGVRTYPFNTTLKH